MEVSKICSENFITDKFLVVDVRSVIDDFIRGISEVFFFRKVVSIEVLNKTILYFCVIKIYKNRVVFRIY